MVAMAPGHSRIRGPGLVAARRRPLGLAAAAAAIRGPARLGAVTRGLRRQAPTAVAGQGVALPVHLLVDRAALPRGVHRAPGPVPRPGRDQRPDRVQRRVPVPAPVPGRGRGSPMLAVLPLARAAGRHREMRAPALAPGRHLAQAAKPARGREKGRGAGRAVVPVAARGPVRQAVLGLARGRGPAKVPARVPVAGPAVAPAARAAQAARAVRLQDQGRVPGPAVRDPVRRKEPRLEQDPAAVNWGPGLETAASGAVAVGWERHQVRAAAAVPGAHRAAVRPVVLRAATGAAAARPVWIQGRGQGRAGHPVLGRRAIRCEPIVFARRRPVPAAVRPRSGARRCPISKRPRH